MILLNIILRSAVVILLASVLFLPAAHAQQSDNGNQVKKMKLEQVSLPPGFKIDIFADGVRGARSMTMTPGGTLFVGNRTRNGRVYAILDHDKDYRADEVITIAEGWDTPNGVAFMDGSLYIAQIDKIWRFDNIEQNLRNPPKPVLIFDNLPSDRHHGWKYLRIGPDGRLYTEIGAPCNVCERPDPYATLVRLNTDGTEFEIFARGVRRSVGFDWDPRTGEMWFTDNGRDMLGDDIPPCELNHAPRPGMHFGFPYLHGKDIPDPVFGKNAGEIDITVAAQTLGPHVAPLGMRFYTGGMFPEEYKYQVFIAEHGSWNRSKDVSHTGYRITLVRIENNVPVSYEVFADGWLNPDGRTRWGRPVDINILPDGSMLVSDDFAGVIYRITYEGS